MKLQILVPRHNEPEEVIKNLLDSIAVQHNVDFNEIGVIIYDDGSDVFLSKKFLNKYPYEIINIKGSHGGVSHARNMLLDNATADYIMYCDADDMFVNLCAFVIIFEQIEIANFDAMYSIFIEETIDQTTGKMFYLNRDNDNTFVHGKVYRRQYLVDENIRWLDNAVYNEDAYFNFLAINNTDKILYCETPFYMWCFNKNSVCRSEPDYVMKTLPYMIDNDIHLVEELSKRNKYEKAIFTVVNMILEVYYDTHRPHWLLEENKEGRERSEKAIGAYFKKFQGLWSLANEEYIQWVWNNLVERLERFEEHLEIEEPFDVWIKHCMELSEKE